MGISGDSRGRLRYLLDNFEDGRSMDVTMDDIRKVGRTAEYIYFKGFAAQDAIEMAIEHFFDERDGVEPIHG